MKKCKYCGNTKDSIRDIVKNDVYYICSQKCKEKFVLYENREKIYKYIFYIYAVIVIILILLKSIFMICIPTLGFLIGLFLIKEPYTSLNKATPVIIREKRIKIMGLVSSILSLLLQIIMVILSFGFR